MVKIVKKSVDFRYDVIIMKSVKGKEDKNMTREQCEKKIRHLMIQIDKVYHEYNPEGTYLNLSIVDDNLMAHNSYYSDDADHPIDMFHVIKRKDNHHEA